MAKFLIVDEADTARLFLAVALKTADQTREATILEADNRKEALRLFREHKPDIVFCETKVGMESGQSIMADLFKERRGACVIVCSGRGAEHPEVREALSKGAFGFLPKPIRLDTVRRTLREVEHEIAGLGRIL